MKRRDFLKTTAASSGLLIAPSLLSAGVNSQKKPNILFIMTDQQHDRMMSCADNPWLNTPHLDGLAAEGIRFEKAYATNPVCVPSRVSMATGMMPGRLVGRRSVHPPIRQLKGQRSGGIEST